MPTKSAKRVARPGPGRLSAEGAAGLMDRLLDAAHALFNKQGFSETTIDQIAKEAGASTKTIYTRFANKGEIMQAVVHRLVERSVASMPRQILDLVGQLDDLLGNALDVRRASTPVADLLAPRILLPL